MLKGITCIFKPWFALLSSSFSGIIYLLLSLTPMDETDRLSWQQILRLNFISWFHLLEREKEKKLLFISRTQVQGAIGTEKRKEF